MANNSETSVPKFGSFKPRSVAKPVTSPRDDTKSNGKQREMKLGNHRVEKPKTNRTIRDDEHRSKTLDETQQDRQDGKERHRDSAANRDNKYLAYQIRNAKPYYKRDREPHYADTSFVDTRGDPANLQYPNKWNVPRYYLYGCGSIVGLDPDIKIDRKLSDQNSYTLIYPHKKRPVEAFQLSDIEEPFEGTAAGHDAREIEGKAVTGNIVQSAETDFVPLPFRQVQDDAPRMPIVTPKT